MTKQIKVLLVEDDELYAQQVAFFLESMNYECVARCKAMEEVMAILQHQRVDLIVSDVHFEGRYDGLQLALKMEQQGIPIVLMTQDDDVYKEAEHLKDAAFLMKPFHKYTLDKTIKMLLQTRALIAETEIPTFFVRDKGVQKSIKITDIQWIEAEGNYSTIVLEKEKYALKKSMAILSKELPDNGTFIQIHRNYFINKELIQKINFQENIIWVGTHQLPIGKSYKDSIRKNINIMK